LFSRSKLQARTLKLIVMISLKTIILISVFGFGIQSHSEGALAIYSFSGFVNESGGNIPIGSAFKGRFTFNIWQAGRGPYINGTNYDYTIFEILIGKDHLRYEGGVFTVDNDGPFAGDRVDVEFGGGSIGGLSFSHGRFRLVDSSNVAIDSMSLPFESDLSRWPFKEVRFYASNVDIIGRINELTYTPVPEPKTSFLVIVVWKVFLIRRKRNQA
jgi:hypothetical protein